MGKLRIKFLELNGRLVPLIGGAKDEEPPQNEEEQKEKPQTQEDQKPEDKANQDYTSLAKKIEELEKKLQELSQKPETQENQEKKEEVEKQIQELMRFKQAYFEEKLKNEIFTKAKDAVDPEILYELLKPKAQFTEDGKILVNGKPVEEAIKELLNKKPYLKKVSQRTGSGAKPTIQEPQKEKSPREVFKEKLLGG